ncbi:MAG: antitoxin, partial [Hyphomicrobiales bacterium]|nr:antitoxin [Hyphomicrobiales bacterium]
MANKPKSVDPAEAALSAVEEALKIDFAADEAEAKAPEPTVDERIAEEETVPAAPAAANAAADENAEVELTPRAKRRARRTARPANDAQDNRLPANDDRRTVGNLIYALQRRPSGLPIYVAFLLSVLWIGAGAAFGFALWGSEIRAIQSLEALRNAPHLVALGIAIVVPVLFFLVMGALIRRTQEMRLVSRAMTEVAVRLAEPESVAKESVISVSQAIRREVTAMGDGIERALARASELEVMVHNEVASLERSYNDNELRIRGLIEELVSQRESVVNNAERVRSAIDEAHKGMSLDLSNLGER